MGVPAATIRLHGYRLAVALGNKGAAAGPQGLNSSTIQDRKTPLFCEVSWVKWSLGVRIALGCSCLFYPMCGNIVSHYKNFGWCGFGFEMPKHLEVNEMRETHCPRLPKE
jgi:hypothetical protein